MKTDWKNCYKVRLRKLSDNLETLGKEIKDLIL